MALAREVCALREKQRVLLDRTRRVEHVAAVCARERDAFEREVQRLRHPMLKGAPPSSQSLQLQLVSSPGVGAELEREMRMFQQTDQHDWDGTVEVHDDHHGMRRSAKPKQLATSAYRGAHALTRPRIEGRGQIQGVIGSGQGNDPSMYTSSVLSNATKHLLAVPYTGTTAMVDYLLYQLLTE